MIKSIELAHPNSCLNRAAPDELLFVLRAHDKAAPATVHAWAAERRRVGKDTVADSCQIEADEWIRTVLAQQGVTSFRVISGMFAGAIVIRHFTTSSGYTDCRFLFRHGPHEAGSIVVVKPDNLEPYSVAKP